MIWSGIRRVLHSMECDTLFTQIQICKNLKNLKNI